MTVNYLGGLPRAGSTILTALIAQNPNFHVTGTSPLPHIVEAITKARTGGDFKALQKKELDIRIPGVIRGAIDGWFSSITENHCIDKSRGWLGKIDLLNSIYNTPAKIIVPIRDPRGVIASMEKLHRANPTIWSGGEGNIGLTVQSRVDNYIENTVLKGCFERIFEAVQRNQIGQCLIVRIEDLVQNPQHEMNRIWEYLGVEQFDNDFGHIINPTEENDAVFEPFGEHTIRNSLGTIPEDWDQILPVDSIQSITQRLSWFFETFYKERL